MISEKTKHLFHYIEYLHTNISNFKQYNEIIIQLQNLGEERNNLKPRENFADKLKYDKIQAELIPKFDIIHEKITVPLYNKAIELEIGYYNNQRLWRWDLSEIYNLKENFEEDDIPEILLHRDKYIEFKESAESNYFNDMFFQDLHRDVEELFAFFSNPNENGLEKFKLETKEVNNIGEAFQMLKHGVKNFSIPIDSLLNPNKVQKENLKPDYWEQDFDNEKLVLEFDKYINKIIEKADNEKDLGCLPNRFRMLPRIILQENKYDLQRKKYLLKKMYLSLEPNKSNEIINELFSEFIAIVEPYADIFDFITTKTHQNKNSSSNEKYKTQNLFKVGLLFAKGEMNKYFNVNKKDEIVIKSEFTAPKIAKKLKDDLGITVSDKFILASLKNYTDRENKGKNIFHSFDMMTKIISHCETEKITVDAYFKSRLPME